MQQPESLGVALREVSRLMNQARTTKRALRQLQDYLSGGLLLGVFNVTASDDMEQVIACARRAVTEHDQVVIQITALQGSDEGASHGPRVQR